MEVDEQRLLKQQLEAVIPQHGAASERNHRGPGRHRLPNGSSLSFPKHCLVTGLEAVQDRPPGDRLRHVVCVDEGPAQLGRHQPADRRLADAHEPGQGDRPSLRSQGGSVFYRHPLHLDSTEKLAWRRPCTLLTGFCRWPQSGRPLYA